MHTVPSGAVTDARPTTRVRPVIAACLLAVLLAMLDGQIMATALPRVVADLDGLRSFAWVTTAYLIASTVTTPMFGKLGDQFGRKGVFVTSIAVFVVGSAACGWAHSIDQLVAFRVVQGVGAGGLFVSVLAVIGELFPPREGARYYGWFAIVFAVSAVAGPLVGGTLTDAFGWRWVFYVNLPPGVAALVLVGAYLHLPTHRRRPRLDYAGFLLLSALIVTLVLLAGWAGGRYTWTSAPILGLTAAAAVLTAAFVVVERGAAEPVIPPRLFRDPTFAVCVVVSVVAGFVFLGPVNYLGLYLQVAAGVSATMSGMVLLPMMIGLVAASGLSARRISATGRYKWYPVASMTLGALSAALLATISAGATWTSIVGVLLLFGVAAGLNMQVLAIAARNTAPRDDLGAVSATVALSRTLGTSLGIAVFGTLFSDRLADGLADTMPGIGIDALTNPTVRDGLPAPVLATAQEAGADALGSVFLLALPVFVIGLVCALLLRDLPLRSHD